MNEYYYTPNPDVVHELHTWKYELLGNDLKFTTDNGVFSKKTVDYGSSTLVKNINIDKIPAGNILDLGCGYGPMGIALAKNYPNRIFEMVDVNNLALSLAKKNAEQNSVKNVKIHNSNIYEDVKDRFAAILTNPPVRAGKKVVNDMISGSLEHLVQNGTLTVVLQKKQGAPSAKKLMNSLFGNCKIIRKDKGYYILESTFEG
ncbi:class I SAM-dependent methyltransferase [Apilactobacillus timberlakei]|uniref:class I SAM-dependent methyltransferase n=1 Tax=Apilactobacillus timberlakei TaxID=2008380 RepID=UPI0011281EC4|nr:class I SAM-dependent methyltransferase [Apilactobacillus timberlakei]TPR17917.1 class I SAM-dependent methyltransferase [Apilactobacillus timberlakei]TPR19723.1 class I SAM-dependent methyltransferase [Apilactobacillus timberlakei]TPR21229.1 class I SAM-dependent methyltransferase [Apilactobacillus timberlakei]